MADHEPPGPLSPTDFHVLLVLAEEDLYGYAILKAIEDESGGSVSPEIGSLYRILARLVSQELVAEAETPEDEDGSHRGRPRRYYRITSEGRRALAAEADRLTGALRLVRHRLDLEAPT